MPDLPEIIFHLASLKKHPARRYAGPGVEPDEVMTCECCRRKTIAAFTSVVIVADPQERAVFFCRACMRIARVYQQLRS